LTTHATGSVIFIFLFLRSFKNVQRSGQPYNINMGYDVNEDEVISQRF